MPSQDRDAVVAALEANLDHIERIFGALPPEVATRRPAGGGWSPLEVLEHLTVVERGVHKAITAAVARPPAETRTLNRDRLVAELATIGKAVEAPPTVIPSGRFGDQTLQVFRDRRITTINLARSLDVDWRAHHGEHPLFGLLDVGQWFILAATHGERHAAQIVAATTPA